MVGDFFRGAGFFIRGVKMAVRPDLRRFVIMPLLINIVAFTIAIWTGIYYFDSLIDYLLPSGDRWWVEYTKTVLWVFFTAIVLLVLFFTFSALANLIGAPFNGLLSEKVELLLSGHGSEGSGGFGEFVSSIIPSIVNELKKIFYFLIVGTGVFFLMIVPGINMTAPIAWVLFSSWMLALEYAAYPMENHKIFFSDVKRELKNKRALAFGFGMSVMLVNMIPFVNFIVMPAAVTGATVLWVEHLSKDRIATGKKQASEIS